MNKSFFETEKEIQISKKNILYSEKAQIHGSYNSAKLYDHCLNNMLSKENIFGGFRNKVYEFFKDRNIKWHEGGKYNNENLPNNNLCSSQISCINHLFHFTENPENFKNVLLKIGYKVEMVLPFISDEKKGFTPYLTFEWIGNKNYLKELSFGKVANDNSRTRGANFTSADFAFRFLDTDNRVRLVLGEWKYAESYSEENKRYSKSKTDRYEKIYKEFLHKPYCNMKMPEGTSYEDLFYDPFDQLMRLQLLAQEMESVKSEMNADIVEILLIVPENNRKYIDNITSPKLKNKNSNVLSLWQGMISDNRFKYYYSENLLNNIISIVKDKDLIEYLTIRYKR